MSRYAMEIRAATLLDAPGLGSLLAEVGHVVDAGGVAERLAALQDGGGIALVAVQWGPPSGLVILHWYGTLLAPRPVAVISTLLVAAEDRRRGIGRMLVKAAAQAARVAGCGDMEIMAGPGAGADAVALQEFCGATGFEAAGARFVRPLRKRA